MKNTTKTSKMLKYILPCLLLFPTISNAAQIGNAIEASCYRLINDIEKAKNCTILQKDAARYVLRFARSSKELNKLASDCADGSPYPNDWLFIKICVDMKIHNIMYGTD